MSVFRCTVLSQCKRQATHRLKMSKLIMMFILFTTFTDPVGSILVLVLCWWDDVVHWALTLNYMRFDFNHNKLTLYWQGKLSYLIICVIHGTIQTGSINYLSLHALLTKSNKVPWGEPDGAWLPLLYYLSKYILCHWYTKLSVHEVFGHLSCIWQLYFNYVYHESSQVFYFEDITRK